jgi:uncharacterized protein HemY
MPVDDHEQVTRRAAKAAADALRPAVAACRAANAAGQAWDRATPTPWLRPSPAATERALNSALEAIRIFDWIAAGMPPPGAKEGKTHG